MHREEENKRLTQRIALLEDELNIMRNRMQNLQSNILSNISHNIRTPMNAIVGFANLLTNEQMDNKDREDCIDQINSNSTELLEIIDNMIDASLLQCDHLTLFKKECNVNNILDDLFDIYNKSTTVRHKKLNLIVSKGENNDFTIVTDYKRLKQVLHNLISNAVKFTNSGDVEFGYNRLKDDKVTFFVKDTGIGLGPLNHEDLFKPFNVGTNSDKFIIYQGAGLGLAVSKNLIKLMGGDMWPENVPEGGTCFYFTLPAKRNSFQKSKLQFISALTKFNIASFFYLYIID